MIHFKYIPFSEESPFGLIGDPPVVQELNMTLADDITWSEATVEFHKFLRAAGYVIPYDFEMEDSK